MKLDPERFQRISKVLADGRRFGILEAIRSAGGVTCKDLLDEFGIAPATMSHHLKELAGAGLIETEREGQCLMCRPRRDVLKAYVGELGRRLGNQE